MSGITVCSPIGINRVAARPIAPRLTSLAGIRLGVLNNSKPNSLALQERIVERIRGRFPLEAVVVKQKYSAAVGAEDLAGYARGVDAVITAISD